MGWDMGAYLKYWKKLEDGCVQHILSSESGHPVTKQMRGWERRRWVGVGEWRTPQKHGDWTHTKLYNHPVKNRVSTTLFKNNWGVG